MRTPQQQKRYEYKKAWAKANAEKMRLYRKQYEERNTEKVSAYRSSEEFKQFTRKNVMKYQRKYPEKTLAKVRKRQMLKLQATPLWVNYTRINALYSLAAMLTKATGEKHHVDHIVPIKNKYVCGFHVYENLKVIPAKQNLLKSNKFTV